MSDQFADADAAFDRDIPEHLREDVMTMICEAAQGWSEHEAVTILERDRLDAINVRAHGIVTVGDDEFTFIVEDRSEEHTSELQSLMRISYAVFCLKKKNKKNIKPSHHK